MAVKEEVKAEGQPCKQEPDSGAAEGWSSLLLDLAQVRLGKRKAAQKEDFAEASRLKRREAELGARLEALQPEAPSGGAEIQQLEEAKRRAVEAEDFAEASRLKKRLKVLGEGGASAEDARRRAWEGALDLARQSGAGPDLLAELQAAGPPDVAGKPRSAAPSAATKQEGGVGAAKRERPETEGGSMAQPSPAKPEAKEVKEEAPTAPLQQEQAGDCPVPGLTLPELLAMSNQDLWQHAWNMTWQEADAQGRSGDQSAVYAEAQRTWKGWLAERNRQGREPPPASPGVPEDAPQQEPSDVAPGRSSSAASSPPAGEAPGRQPPAASSPSSSASAACPRAGGLSQDQLAAQEAAWNKSEGARSDWHKLTAEAEKRRRARDEAPKSGCDLCVVVKQRCPADQPLRFERLLAVCPKGTTVRQLVSAMSKEPQEFRQNWDGSEYCVRPANSRCADWLPVQASMTPPGFREDAALPEQMLSAAKAIFEERLKPQGQQSEESLSQFLTATGRLPPDTPLPFEEILKHCPPGTEPMELIRMMSKRRELFRQDKSGRLFCVRPRARCGTWPAVSPYGNPLAAAAPRAAAPARAPTSTTKATPSFASRGAEGEEDEPGEF